ncbi:MAG TPA: hypothetical protein VMF12_03810 [Xanthobacteraceae bacterium]|nr:hypothetical protein [Xanthobacteraceae bacterium]
MLRSPEHPSRSLYFVNGWVDGALIGGLSIIVFIALRLFARGEVTREAVLAASVLSVFFNYPHFSATLYRLYQSPDNVRQFPVTSIGLPILLIGAIAASLWQPDLVAPYLITLLLFWSPYHYSGQTIGITMLYARRSGFEVGRWQRLALSTFVFSTFIANFSYPRSGDPIMRYGVLIPVMHFPAWFAELTFAIMIVSGAALLGFAFTWSRARKKILPPIVLLPALTQLVWSLPGKQSAMFIEFVPLFHSLQYLYIAWAMQIGLRMGEPAADGPRRLVSHETLRWLLRNSIGGIAMFIALPWVLFWVNVPMVTVAGIVVAALNIQHFFVDGVIWKLRNTRATSPLMLNLADWAPQGVPVTV